MAYYSLAIRVVRPTDISPGSASRGWIGPNGTIYAGEGEHESILKRILQDTQIPSPRPGSGWIRWIGAVHGTLFLDWSEYGNSNSETLARSIAKQVTYPFKQVWIDGLADERGLVSWKGPVDDFVKFGIKGRRGEYFESRLDARLRAIK